MNNTKNHPNTHALPEVPYEIPAYSGTLLSRVIGTMVQDTLPDTDNEKYKLGWDLFREVRHICETDLEFADVVQYERPYVWENGLSWRENFAQTTEDAVKPPKLFTLYREDRITSYIDSEMRAVPIAITVAAKGAMDVITRKFVPDSDRTPEKESRMIEKAKKRFLGDELNRFITELTITIALIKPQADKPEDRIITSSKGAIEYAIDAGSQESYRFAVRSTDPLDVEKLQELLDLIKQSEHV